MSDPSERDVEPEEIVTKPGDEFVGAVEDVSARGPSNLESLHGGSRSLPDYGQTARENFEEVDE